MAVVLEYTCPLVFFEILHSPEICRLYLGTYFTKHLGSIRNALHKPVLAGNSVGIIIALDGVDVILDE